MLLGDEANQSSRMTTALRFTYRGVYGYPLIKDQSNSEFQILVLIFRISFGLRSKCEFTKTGCHTVRQTMKPIHIFDSANVLYDALVRSTIILKSVVHCTKSVLKRSNFIHLRRLPPQSITFAFPFSFFEIDDQSALLNLVEK
jgi:hypothetical protein